MKTFDTILDEFYARKSKGRQQACPVDDTDLLLSKAIEGRATKEEQQRLSELFAQQPELEDLLNVQKSSFDQFLSQPLPPAKAIPKLQPRTVRWMPMMLRFAACFVAVAGGFIVYSHLQTKEGPSPIPIREGGTESTVPAQPAGRTRGLENTVPAQLDKPRTRGGTDTVTTNEPAASTNATAVSGTQ